jgi:hypothetical protein
MPQLINQRINGSCAEMAQKPEENKVIEHGARRNQT